MFINDYDAGITLDSREYMETFNIINSQTSFTRHLRGIHGI